MNFEFLTVSAELLAISEHMFFVACPDNIGDTCPDHNSLFNSE